MPSRGFTLVETIFAIFLLSMALFLLISLFDGGLHYLTDSSALTRASVAAESRMERVRSWAAQGSNFDTPSSYPALATFVADPLYPGLETKVDLSQRQAYSPDSSSEWIQLPSDRRQMNASLLRASVTVRWGQEARQQVRLVSDVARTDKGWHPAAPLVITLNPSTTTLAQGTSLDATVQAFDAANQAIPDLKFQWAVIAVTSAGSIVTQSRDGSRCTFIHRLPRLGGGFTFGPSGECWLQVRARYWGVEKSTQVVLTLS